MGAASVVRINEILDRLAAYHPEADFELLQRAYVFSAKVHHGQTRLSGEPYLSHPLSVAMMLTELNLDEYAVVTGLLHDTVEDTIATIDEIKELFGPEVAFLVDGVTKISEISNKSKSERQAENFRKIILAMSKDIRVILIKLCDRVHNMRTLKYLPPDKQKLIAQQTLDIFAPLANRLGLFLIKRELEDLSLRYVHEKVYVDIRDKLSQSAEQREAYVREVIGIIDTRLRELGIVARIEGRPKHIYSIYKKMLEQNLDFSQIYDLTAVRVIVAERRQCYDVLGLVHQIWRPVTGRFKDYISMPKNNMYQSLHTTVMGPSGQRVEIQIRSEEMDRVAKRGIAAHWKYKEGRRIEQKHDQRFAWLQQMMESHADVKDSRDFLEAFRVDVFPDEVYVFTPLGDVIELPSGSTPVDFAYCIHTDIGNRCTGARVNGAIAPLKQQLKSGDVVEIITQANHQPSRDWLKFVKTNRAKSKIRHWVRQQERSRSITLGREIWEKELRKHKLSLTTLLRDETIAANFAREGIKNIDDLCAAVGHGRVSVAMLNRCCQQAIRQDETPVPTKPSRRRRRQDRGIVIQGFDDIMVRFGKCCNPVPGDDIMGFITRGRGVTVHTAGCPFLDGADPERIIEAHWDQAVDHVARVPIEVICEDKKGLLADITASISATETNIVNARIRTSPDGKAVCVFEVEVHSLDQLDVVAQAVRKVRGVLSFRRLKT